MESPKPPAHDLCLEKMRVAWEMAKLEHTATPVIDEDCAIWDYLDHVVIYTELLSEMKLSGSVRAKVLRDASLVVTDIMAHDLNEYFGVDLIQLIENV
jgi:hypothetical protein